MIKEHYEDSYLDTAISGCDLARQIAEIDKTDPELAGELAKAAFVYIHTGGLLCSDNPTVNIILNGHRTFVEKNAGKCIERAARSDEKEIEREQLDIIADLLNQGYKQIEICTRLNKPKSTISDRCRKIRNKYPEMLREKNPDSSGASS